MSGPIGTVPNQQPNTARDHNQRRGSADLRVRPLGACPITHGRRGTALHSGSADLTRVDLGPAIVCETCTARVCRFMEIAA